MVRLAPLIPIFLAIALAAGGCACAGAGACRTDAAAPMAVANTAAAAPDTTTPPPPTPEETTLTFVGQAAPDITVATVAGDSFALAGHRGKIVLVNWFATWCAPCREEMPHLKSRVWEAFAANPDFVMISISREEEAAKVAAFAKDRELPWTFGLDTDRKAYAQYAEAYIPRNHVIGRDGRILFQSEGFDEEEFATMIATIAAALDP